MPRAKTSAAGVSHAAATAAHHHTSSSNKEKVDPMTLLFRNEVLSFLASSPVPPPHLATSGALLEPITVLGAMERLSSSGFQQSVQLCKSGDEIWVTRTEGGREYFPRAARVTKRGREVEPAAIAEEEVTQLANVGEESENVESSPRKKRRSRSHKKPVDNSGDIGSLNEPALPVPSGGRSGHTRTKATMDRSKASPSSHHPSISSTELPEMTTLGATHRRSRHADAENRLPIRGLPRSGSGDSVDSNATLRARVIDALGRGRRKCAGRDEVEDQARQEAILQSRREQDDHTATNQDNESVIVKRPDDDELTSLCGKVGGLDVKSVL